MAYKDGVVAKENLPYPIVMYPGFYGTFFAFKKEEDGEFYFCSCCYEAVGNYLKIRLLRVHNFNSNPTRNYILDSAHFPLEVVVQLMRINPGGFDVLKDLMFEDKLCHECNLQTPSYRYCLEIYGGAFKQNYGWYINKQKFEWGIDVLFPKVILEDCCPIEILELQQKFNNESLDQSEDAHARRVTNFVENEVRRKFGHKNIGESWISETILFYLIKKIFSKYQILRHYRPNILQGLELDIFIPDLRLGIEYQGIQHYKPIKHWGGKEALKQLQDRDRKKKILCQELGIRLVYFEFNEGLSEEYVISKLSDYV